MYVTEQDDILRQVDNYYTGKVKTHGTTHWGVDWNSTESQYVRFAQLLKLHSDFSQKFSINDYGCGYGALVDYLLQQGGTFTYSGYDISTSMIDAARERYDQLGFVSLTSKDTDLLAVDYTVSSGIFNVRFEIPDEAWERYLLDTLHKMWRISEKGIAFNCLTSYSDPEYMKTNLYYANPCFLFDYCKKHFSRQVALLHDYGLYEFTILVRRQA